jgi:hypothetical protein
MVHHTTITVAKGKGTHPGKYVFCSVPPHRLLAFLTSCYRGSQHILIWKIRSYVGALPLWLTTSVTRFRRSHCHPRTIGALLTSAKKMGSGRHTTISSSPILGRCGGWKIFPYLNRTRNIRIVRLARMSSYVNRFNAQRTVHLTTNQEIVWKPWPGILSFELSECIAYCTGIYRDNV